MLKIKGKAEAWSIFAGVTACLFTLLMMHGVLAAKKLNVKGLMSESLTLGVLKKRLLK